MSPGLRGIARATAAIGLTLALLAPAAGHGVPASAPAGPEADIQGEWRVTYVDQVLGPVSGSALVEGDAVTIELRHPKWGERVVLTSSQVAWDGRRAVIVLDGMAPLPDELPDGLLDPAQPVVTDPGGGVLEIRRGEQRGTHPVHPRPETDLDSVTLELSLSANGRMLSGRWQYRADPYLRTDSRGLGRRGPLEAGEDGAWWAHGAEVWTRPEVEVRGVVVLEDQMGQEVFSDGTAAPHYTYPFGDAARDDAFESRTLFVYGRDLPPDQGRDVVLEAIDPGVEYRVYRHRADAEAWPDVARMFEEGWRRARAQLAATGAEPWEVNEALADLSALLVRARIGPEAVPGYNTFRADGSEAGWLLQFGDNVGAMRVVRRTGALPHQLEHVTWAFAGERVRIEVRTRLVLPVDHVPVIVGVNGEPALLGPGTGIPALRSPDDPRVYRTELIQLTPGLPSGVAREAGQGAPWHRVGVRQGDALTAISGQPGLLSLAPDMARAAVVRTPRDSAVGGDWSVFLGRAAACAGVEMDDRVAAERAEAERIAELLIDSGRSTIALPGWIDTRVNVGQHAGMLLLHDTYLRLMLRSRAQLRRLTSDLDVLLFRRSIESRVRQGNHPLTRIPVTGPDGGPLDFGWTFETDLIAQIAGTDVAETRAWAVAATREALAAYDRLLGETIDETQALEACDVEGLLRLTGSGFEPVAALARSKLVRRGPAPQHWVPDRRARAHVDAVAFVGDQLAIQDRLGEADTEAARTAVLLATIPVALGGAVAGWIPALVGVALVDVADIAHVVYHNLDEKWRGDAEVAFALASAEILGMGPLERAERQQIAWAELVFGRLLWHTAPTLAGFGVDVWQIFALARTPLQVRRLARGAEALDAVAGGGGSAAAARTRDAAATPELRRILEDTRSGEAAGDLTPVREPTPPAPAARPPREVDAEALTEAVTRHAEDVATVLRHGDDDLLRGLGELDASDVARALDDSGLEDLGGFENLDVVLGHRRPPWAAAFDADDFERLRPLLTRPDLARLLEEGAGTVAAALSRSDEARRTLAWRVLEFEPTGSVDRFSTRLDELVERVPQNRGPEYFAQAAPSDAATWRPLEAQGWHVKDLGLTGVGYSIRDPDGNVGEVIRNFDPERGRFVMQAAFRRLHDDAEPIAGTIRGVRVPAFRDRIPTMDLMQMRAMHALGIRFGPEAAGAARIREVVMHHIGNLRTLVTVNWWKRLHFPNTPWEEIPAERITELLLSTHSLEYTQRLLAGAGYRVKSATLFLDTSRSGRMPLSGLSDDFLGPGGESWDAFLARYAGLDGSAPADVHFDIHLTVEPARDVGAVLGGAGAR